MAGDVVYSTGAQMISALGAANTAVSGMTYAEAAAALGGVAQAAENGAEVVNFPLPFTEYGQVTIEAQYAAQLWEYWKTIAGAEGTTVLGAAAGSAITYARGVLIGTGEGLAATAGVLTMSVPTAVAMAAPLIGVGLGVALYETNPELWTRISDTVVGWCNKGTQTISALVTAAGQILLPKGLVDELEQLKEEEGWGQTGGYSSSDIVLQQFSQPIAASSMLVLHKAATSSSVESLTTYTTNRGEVAFCVVGTRSYIITSGEANSLRLAVNTKTKNNQGQWVDWGTSYYGPGTQAWISGKQFYTENLSGPAGSDLAATTIESGASNIATSGSTMGDAEARRIGYILLYGTHESGGWPDGVSEWGGVTPDLANTPTTPVYDPATGTTTPYYPVHLPGGSTPGTTETNPASTTDPTRVTPPVEYPDLDPYIPPVVSPEIQWPDAEEVPVPDPVELTNPDAVLDPIYVAPPELDPATDPSTVPEPLPEPATNDPGTNGRPPQSGGTSPGIAFPLPDVPFPTISPSASETPVVSGEPGFVQVYHPSPSELVSFGRWLWVTYADATIDKIWNNPFDGVIGCHELYATPTDGGYTTIRCGFLDSGVSSQLVRVRYSTINCGSMIIPEYWGNYLDYSPYSKAYIYLPFIGIQELDVDDVVGHSVNVCYHIDAYNGSCIAQITCAKDGYANTIYQFSGNCAVEYPLSGGSQAAIKAAMMTGDAYQTAANVSANASLIGGIGSGLASAIGGVAGGIAQGLGGNVGGGIASGISGLAHGAASAISGYASSVAQRSYGQAQHTANMLSGKSIVQHSGNFGASYGAMGIKKPYIFIRRPIQKVVNNYNVLYGYPAHKQVIIGNCTGFLRCREVHVVSPLATDNEKTLIEQLLTTGVYVTDEFSQLNS